MLNLPVVLAAAVLAAGSFTSLRAETYPSQPVKVVIGYPPGGSTDIAGRIVAEALSAELGQRFVVENRPGANSAIAAENVARSKDRSGHTLLFTSTSTMVVNPFLVKDVSYKPLEDFEPVALVGSIPMIITASKNANVTSLKNLIEAGRQKPGEIGFAAATGSLPQIAVELLKLEAGVKLEHVPYKGGAQALADALGGHVDLVVDTPTLLLPRVLSGELIPLGVTSAQRLQKLPDTPTIGETFPGFEVTTYFAIYGPAGTNEAAIRRLNGAVSKILEIASVRNRLEELGITIETSSPRELKQRISRDFEKYGDVINKAGIQPNQ